MAVYYTSKCPHCGQVYERRKDNPQPYGSPFKRCRSCGNEFVDTSYVEPGLLEKKDFKERSFGWGAPVLIAIGIGVAAMSFQEMYTLGIAFGLGMIVLGMISIISNIKWKPDEDTQLLEMIAESKKRLADPHYVIALWKNGCFVTTEIVQWARKEVGSQAVEFQKLEEAVCSETNV